MTTPTEWRELCAELFAAIQLYTGQNPAAAEIPSNQLVRQLMDAMAATATALAQPEPEGPTDDELLQVAATTIEPYESSGIAVGEYEAETECAVEVYGSELIAYARAVFARWGRPVIEPVPVSERPWERDAPRVNQASRRPRQLH